MQAFAESTEMPMKILLPVDGSAYTKRMLSYIAAHDELLGPRHEYTLFTVVLRVPPHATRFVEHATLEGYYRDEAEHVFHPLREFAAQQGWKARTESVTGHAADEIAAAATTGHYGLVVMGTHGHSALAGVVLGSVATAVLARCSTPVLLIR